MNKITSVLVLGISMLILISSCGSPTSDDGENGSITISGMVVDDNNTPVENAIVRIISPPPEEVTTTDSTGAYQFDLQVDSTITYTIEATKEGFPSKTEEVLAVPDRDIEMPDFKLAQSDTGDGDDGSEEEPTGSEGSAYISLTDVSSKEIRVNSAGGTETTQLTFEVTDSSGTPVSNQNAVYVNFDILEGPDGGESIYPDSVLTQNGEATATLKSGTVAGVVQIQASFMRDEGTEKMNVSSGSRSGDPMGKTNGNPSLTSSTGNSTTQETVSHESKPVQVTINGGLPSADYFKLQAETQNMAAATDESNTITVDLGDKYGNNVPEGTSVYFKTTKGTIKGSGETDADGIATTSLQTGSAGLATITAETIDENSQTISKEIDVLFSGLPELTVSPSNVSLEKFTEEEFEYTLQDENGNPLATGTTVSVTVDNENLTLSGDTDLTLKESTDAGSGTTEFSFTLNNPDQVTFTESATVTISADGPNGTVEQKVQLLPPDVDPAEPESITLESVSNTEIGVKETGQTESTNLTFQVTNLNGQPLDLENAAEVSFSFGSQPNGGEELSPEIVETNGNGQATTTLTSGTESGVVQVKAVLTKSDGSTIASKPVSVTIHAGLPDQDHFTLEGGAQNVVFKSDEKVTFTAYAGDVHGNIVPEGTSIYFTTDGGYIGGSAKTNADGEASVTLTPKNPLPPNGIATITAETADDNENTVLDQVELVFSQEPQLSISTNSIDLDNFQSETIDYTLEDSNGHPMAEGTNISVSASNSDLVLSGDTDITTEEETQSGAGATEFSFELSNPDNITFTQDATVTVSVDGPNGSVSEQIALVAPDTPVLNPGNITLAEVTENEIGVVGTGQTEQTQLTFQVTDSMGRKLDFDNQTEVQFSLGANPGGEADLEAKSVMTDAQGQASTTLTSGTEAGVVQVVAEVEASDGTMITSQPVSIVIHAGLPDQDHFSIKSEVNNVPAESGEEVAITAYVGDRYGNIVPEGTAVYFTTSGGNITASGTTNTEGIATATLRAVSPTPTDGIATVTASTADDQQNTITATRDVLFSGGPEITVTPETFNINNAEDQQFDYTIADADGNPMAPGTEITVTPEAEGINVIGDVEITVGSPNSSLSNLNQLTDYTFNISDADPNNTTDDPVQITIEVDGPNGTARKTITGTKAKTR